MGFMPDFIEDYHNEVHDDVAAKNLRGLATEYNKKKDDLENSSAAKARNAHMWEKVSGQKSEVNLGKELKELENDYKQKAMDMARPHIEDTAKFEELAKKHAPEQKQGIDRNDPNLSASQEKMVEIKQGLNKQEDKQAALERKREELNKIFNQNSRDLEQGRS